MMQLTAEGSLHTDRVIQRGSQQSVVAHAVYHQQHAVAPRHQQAQVRELHSLRQTAWVRQGLPKGFALFFHWPRSMLTDQRLPDLDTTMLLQQTWRQEAVLLVVRGCRPRSTSMQAGFG